jgi:hypothetical protein
MTTRYRLLVPMLVIKDESGPPEVRSLTRVTAEKLASMHSVSGGAPTHYAIWPEPDPDPACYLSLVEPKKKET